MKRLLLALLFACWAVPAQAAWALVGTPNRVVTFVGVDNVSSTSVTYTAGNAIVVGTYAYHTGGASTITSVVCSTDTLAADISYASGNIRTAIYSKFNITGGSETCTVTFGAVQDAMEIYVLEFSGGGSSKQADGTAGGATGTSTSPATGSFSTTGSNDLLVSLVAIDTGGAEAVAAGSGWTIPTNGKDIDGVTGFPGGIEYQLNKASGSYNGTFTIDSNPWNVIAVSFKDAGGGGGGGASTPRLTLLGVGP